MFRNVTIDIRKLRDYCLNPYHPVGKHKARVFSAQLGLERRDAGILKEEIIRNIKHAEIHKEFEDEYGIRYSANIELNMNNRVALVKTLWIIRTDDNTPSFVTCYVIT